MTRENWTSSIGFILASAGSAIGLGNIWKFPYMAGENGGGTFVLVYVLCVIFIGLPVMCSEMLIGRHTRRNIINAMGKIERLSANQKVRFVMSALSAGMAVAFATMHAWLPVVLALAGVYLFAKKGFAVLGWVCTIVALAILSYYAVIGGWIVEYIRLSLTGTLVPEAIDGAAATAVAQTSQTAFGAYVADPWRVLVGFVIFMAVTGWMLLGGIRAGIERMSKILMPLLFILLLVVIVRSVTLPGAGEGIEFLLKPTMDAFTPQVVLMALGQVFFSLSLGMAITVTYGSYLHKEHNILKAAGWVGVLDTCAALMAGLAIFPAVFAVGLEPSAGPGLIFGALPAVFDSMWLGPVWATCFFFMLFIAAVTSSVALLECGATVFIERLRRGHKRGSRRTAVLIGFVLCTLMGLLAVFSTADWSHMPWLGKAIEACMGDLNKGNWLDTLDNFASNWILPFTALCTALLVGWGWTPRRAGRELLAQGEDWRVAPAIWGFLLRWVSPIGILFVFLYVAGFLDPILKKL